MSTVSGDIGTALFSPVIPICRTIHYKIPAHINFLEIYMKRTKKYRVDFYDMFDGWINKDMEEIKDDFESLKESPDWLPISSGWNYRFCWIRLVLGFPPNSGMG